MGSPPSSIILSSLWPFWCLAVSFCNFLKLDRKRFVVLSVLAVSTLFFIRHHPKQGEGGRQVPVKGAL